MRKLLIITTYQKEFLIHHKNHTMDISTIKELLSRKYNEIKVMTYEEVELKISEIKEYDIIYTSIENNSNYKKYIINTMYLVNKSNNIYPSFDILLLHDNKSFQETYKKNLNIESLKSKTYTNYNIYNNDQSLLYPLVFKKISGSGSSNVKLVNNKHEVFQLVKEDLIANIKENIKRKNDFKYTLKATWMCKLLNEKLFLKKCKSFNLGDTYFILQEFKDGYSNDYKVLVYYDKIFVLKRNNRDNDFRASGSGKFETGKLSTEILDKVYSFYKRINTPIMSVDILTDNKDMFIIEYQGIHHGPATICLTDVYYKMENNHWLETLNDYKNNKYGVEELFCYAYLKYIEENHE